MNLRTLARKTRTLVDRVRHKGSSPNSFFGCYPSFSEATRNAPTHWPIGYDSPATAEWYRERLEQVNHDDYPVVFWLDKALRAGGTNPRIVEIGGHVGVAYYSFARVIEYPEGLTWTIVDVPSVSRAGEQLAKEKGRTNLKFVHELADVTGEFDVLLASGSLQYVPEPLLPDRLRAMGALPRHILINNTPVAHGAGYVTLQNIGVSTCPYRIHAYSELIEPLAAMGYRVVDRWAKKRAVVVPGHPECTLEDYSGYYLRLNE